ncbi:globin [Lysinibacter cavernae]|uniref:Hemoglobin n=1 Tax=Lysinibacter cavernae TaxID=1640652 RepID=A0A7X5QZS8_9MICO|nr:globin [Lysinibacter cavernae]NIH53040.1 hemoglobin [Lysinibacter cavernae]
MTDNSPQSLGPVSAPAPRLTLRTAENGDATHDTFYAQVGGHETFVKLVHEFYKGIATDPVMKPMYPEEDLGPAEERLLMFLEQYWGGPGTYSENRGHPRLRMRHVPFHVNPDARDRWLYHMRNAMNTLDLAPLHEATMWDYFERAAHAMVNTHEPTP